MHGTLRRTVLCLRVPAGIAALIGLALALAVHIAALRGIDSEADWPRVWLLHGAVFPLVLLAVVTPGVSSGQRRLSFREFLGLIPLPLLILILAALAYALADFAILAPATAAGTPVVKDGHFFFDDHGVMREVTGAEFHRERAATLRLYSGVWAYLYLVCAILLLGTRRPSALGQERG